MKGKYWANKVKAIFINDEPTMTDQSQGEETDINVIVGRHGIGQTAPGQTGEPMYGDWTEFPEDLRAMIDTARKIEEHRDNLPPQLKDRYIEEILALTPEELTTILTPPKKEEPPAPPAEAKT